MKKVYIVRDGDNLKFIIGNIIKIVNIKEITSDSNKSFLSKLFLEFKVFFASKMDEVSIENLPSILSIEQKEDLPTPVIQEMPNKPTTIFSKPIKKESKLTWIKLAEEEGATIIVDDIFIGENVRGIPGTQRALSISPGMPVNLANLDLNQVRNSSILRRLLQNGDLILITTREALNLEKSYQEKMMEEENNSEGGFVESKIIDRSKMMVDGKVILPSSDSDIEEITVEDKDNSNDPNAIPSESNGTMSELIELIDEQEQDEITNTENEKSNSEDGKKEQENSNPKIRRI